jgi:hypothetical protein
MDQNNSISPAAEARSLGGKSWTAFFSVFLVGFALLLFATPIAWAISSILGMITLAASLAIVIFQILHVRSFHLYYDADGVWVYSGVFPWNKGISGVKWRDLDEAVFVQSVGSWLFKSYSILLSHRYTKSKEILLSHWRDGDRAVEAINEQHTQLARSGALQ